MTCPTVAEVREMTPLQRIQWFAMWRAGEREQTIHNLRSRQWSAEAAAERADEIEAAAFERWESAIMGTAQETQE